MKQQTEKQMREEFNAQCKEHKVEATDAMFNGFKQMKASMVEGRAAVAGQMSEIKKALAHLPKAHRVVIAIAYETEGGERRVGTVCSNRDFNDFVIGELGDKTESDNPMDELAKLMEMLSGLSGVRK